MCTACLHIFLMYTIIFCTQAVNKLRARACACMCARTNPLQKWLFTPVKSHNYPIPSVAKLSRALLGNRVDERVGCLSNNTCHTAWPIREDRPFIPTIPQRQPSLPVEGPHQSFGRGRLCVCECVLWGGGFDFEPTSKFRSVLLSWNTEFWYCSKQMTI